MEAVIDGLAAALAGVAALAAAVGGWAWWRVRPSARFWPLLRLSQALALALALVAGAFALAGRGPRDGLFWVYALVPLAAGFVAEQLRLLAAETVLAARGLPDAQALGRLPEAEQRSVVLAIVRREIGVMAAAALVTCFLALRAIGTDAGF